MRQHRYANTTAQQQPQRLADRQQQQSSGAADYHLLPAPPQAGAGFATLPPPLSALRLVAGDAAAQAG